VYPELAAGFESFDVHSLDGTPWHAAYCRVAPDPGAWIPLVAKVNELDRSGQPAWPRERIAALQVPTLLMIGDADVVRPEHTVEMFRLLPAQLAILPGTSHEGMLERTDWLSSMILSFLTADHA
jgi:pimeloyl-ACP methyl ester carboxylesterase